MLLIHLFTMLLCSTTTIVQSSNIFCNNISVTTWVISSCQDNATIKCTTHNSHALIWTVNGTTLLFHLSPNLGLNVTHINFTSGTTCTAYKAWVKEVNQTIESYVTCTGVSGMSEPLHISCSPDDDKAGVCSIVLEDTSCVTLTSNSPSSTTHTTTNDTNLAVKNILGGVVGGVVGGGVFGTILIATIIIIIIKKRAGREMNINTPGSGHDNTNMAELMGTSTITPNDDDDEPENGTELTDRLSPRTAVSRSDGDDTVEHNGAQTIITMVASAGEVTTGEVTTGAYSEDNHQPESKSGAQESSFTVLSIEEHTEHQENPNNGPVLNSECSSVPATEESGICEKLYVFYSQRPPLYETGDSATRACVVSEPKKLPHTEGVFYPSLGYGVCIDMDS